MSRIGRKPVVCPKDVSVKIEGSAIAVSGPKGNLDMVLHERVSVKQDDANLVVERKGDDGLSRSLHGLTRSLLANMVHGVTQGFSKSLEIQGVGYRAQSVTKNKVQFHLGFSHPIEFTAPEGIELKVEGNVVTVSGISKEDVGEVAAKIRKLRKVEPYKGKGIRYAGEYVKKKAGKAGKAAAGGVGAK